MSIIIKDLDDTIISFMELPECVGLMQTNNYYYCKIKLMTLIVEWNKMKNMEGTITKIFDFTCRLGFITYAKSLITRYKIVVNILLFKNICENGQLETAKWLYHHLLKRYGDIIFTFDTFIKIMFKKTCIEGHLETAKWLINIYNKKIDIHEDDNDLFLLMCFYGHLEIAKWLIDLGENYGHGKIDIHAYYDMAFNICCENNKLDVAKWLIDLGENHGYGKINIHNNNNNAFRMSCQGGHSNISKWLIDLEQNHGYGKFD